MIDTRANQYLPDYLITPGEVLEEYLASYGMTQAELADRTGLAKKTINEIIKGKGPVTAETALKLERTLGRPAHFWSNLERQYQEDLTRLAEVERLRAYLAWLEKVPVAAMSKLKWIAKRSTPMEQLEEVLRFFGVSSPAQWETIWREYQVEYRQTSRFEACQEAVSAWLRMGEIQARQIACASFDRKGFLEYLDDIRGLTRDTPQIFQPALAKACAETGVVVVFVPELPRTGVYGATRWLGEKAVIQLSLRYKSNDHLWFTFFHEAGHIVKHGRKEVFLEGNGIDDPKEKEADAFASDKLIPPGEFKRFLSKWNSSLAEVERFASSIGIAPGIVVGRLQHDGLLPNSYGNKLKVFYRWSESQ
jgi:addiction module HigA family antidote